MTTEEIKICTCKDYSNTSPECVNSFRVREDGKSVQLKPRASEAVTTIIIDKCVISSRDARKRSDCLFLYEHRRGIKYAILVELKGRNYISNAFEQLKLTEGYAEYQDIINNFSHEARRTRFIVSNVQLPKHELIKLENIHGLRVKNIIFSEPQTPVPDLKDYI